MKYNLQDLIILLGLVFFTCVVPSTSAAFDPFDCYTETKVLASDGTPGDVFGYSVAIDGNRMVVGAMGDDEAELVEVHSGRIERRRLGTAGP